MNWLARSAADVERSGDSIHESQEDLKTGHDPASYSRELPEDVREGRTGLACMDGFRDDLVSSGWLHNHARMWMAAYLVHWRRCIGKRCRLVPGAPARRRSRQQLIIGNGLPAASVTSLTSSTAAT